MEEIACILPWKRWSVALVHSTYQQYKKNSSGACWITYSYQPSYSCFAVPSRVSEIFPHKYIISRLLRPDVHWSCGESVSWQMQIGIFICRGIKCCRIGIQDMFGTGNAFPGAYTGTCRPPHLKSAFRLSECTKGFSEVEFSLADSAFSCEDI